MTDIKLKDFDRSRRMGPVRWGLLLALIVAVCVGGGWLWFSPGSGGDNAEGSSPEGNTSPPAKNVASPSSLDTGSTTQQAFAESDVDDSASSAPTPSASYQGPDPGASLLEKARAHAEDEELLKARKVGLKALGQAQTESVKRRAREFLSTINPKLLLSPHPMPSKVVHTVKKGDTLGQLARKYDTTQGLIREINNIEGSLIRIGDRLKICTGEFSIKIDRSKNILDLYMDDQFFKRYEVGTGEYNQTPTGDFVIEDRIKQPTWYRPDGKAIPYGDPDNVLGTRWLSLDIQGYGIHGTWEPETIGEQSSAGCIRMLNEEVEQLYTMVPSGTPVTITD